MEVSSELSYLFQSQLFTIGASRIIQKIAKRNGEIIFESDAHFDLCIEHFKLEYLKIKKDRNFLRNLIIIEHFFEFVKRLLRMRFNMCLYNSIISPFEQAKKFKKVQMNCCLRQHQKTIAQALLQE